MEAASMVRTRTATWQPTSSGPSCTRMWGSVAGGWAEHAAFVDERGAAVTERLLELTRPGPGERVLELACGPGGVGLAARRRVAPAARSCCPTSRPR